MLACLLTARAAATYARALLHPPPRARARTPLPSRPAAATVCYAVFEKYYGSKYRAVPLAIGGDQVAHLHWRLLNGELPQAKQPKVVVINIGTNDLGAARADADEHSAEAIVSLAVPGITLRRVRRPGHAGRQAASQLARRKSFSACMQALEAWVAGGWCRM